MSPSTLTSRLSLRAIICIGVVISQTTSLSPIGGAQASWANEEIPIAANNRYNPTTRQQLFAVNNQDNPPTPEVRDLLLAKSNQLFNNDGAYAYRTRNSDDHGSIDLDKLGQVYRYDTVLGRPEIELDDARPESRPQSLNSLFYGLNQLVQEFNRNQVERKRTSRLLNSNEDKDYTFVVSSMADKNNNGVGGNNNNQAAAVAAKYSNQLLREKIQSGGPKYR